MPPAALCEGKWGSYIVLTVVPTRVQLFVKECFDPGLVEVFGLLLHCERLPLRGGGG